MKKIVIFLISLISILNFGFFGFSHKKSNFDDASLVCSAKAETTTYAKALIGCVLYKNSNLSDDLHNIYFIIPETYFVTVLESVSDSVLKVQYDKYVGYVNSSSVLIATFIPIVKTLDNITLDIKETSGTQIWKIPSASSETPLTEVDSGTKGIKYIAEVYGTIPRGGESNLWYYVRFTSPSNVTNVYEGYVYSENITNLSEIVANTETNPEVISSNTEENVNGTIYISSPVRTLIIAIIVVPVIVLASILLYKFVKIIQDKRNKKLSLQKEVADVFESENYSTYKPQSQNFVEDNNVYLKSKIDEMKHTSFVKKQNGFQGINMQNYKSKSYPEFPTYDSEDDLL